MKDEGKEKPYISEIDGDLSDEEWNEVHKTAWESLNQAAKDGNIDWFTKNGIKKNFEGDSIVYINPKK